MQVSGKGYDNTSLTTKTAYQPSTGDLSPNFS